MNTGIVENRLRQFLLALAAFIYLGTVVELILEEHTQEAIQWIPFFLCAIGFLTVVVALLRPARSSLIALRVTMVAVAGGGLLGMGLHIFNNFAFSQEIRPNAALSEHVLEAFQGANPLLAPGILVFTSLMVMIATYYHPKLGKREAGL